MSNSELTTTEKQRLLEALKDAQDTFQHLEVICLLADLPHVATEKFLQTLISLNWNSAPAADEERIIAALEAHLAELTAERTPKPCRLPTDGECHHKSYDKDCEVHGDFGRTPFPASAASVWQRLVTSWQTFGRTLPTDSVFRKEFPIESGVNQYFPAAIVCMAAWSKFNNNKHNPGEPLHHSRNKSGDHEECVARHNFDIADAQVRKDDLTELEEATAVFWRAGARLQILCERLGAPLAPAARVVDGGGK